MKLWQATSIHGYDIGSQTGCKLIAFTQVGMNHVVSYLLVALVFYAYQELCFLSNKILTDSDFQIGKKMLSFDF